MSSRQNGAYISRILRNDPDSTGGAFDALYRGLPSVRAARGFVRVEDGLWLDDHGLASDTEAHVVRAAHGVLWFGCWPVRVQVEILEWSATGCEVAIRPRNFNWPVHTDRYAQCAAEHLEQLARSLERAGVSGFAKARCDAGAPYVFMNGWTTAGNYEHASHHRRQKWNDPTTPAVEPLT